MKQCRIFYSQLTCNILNSASVKEFESGKIFLSSLLSHAHFFQSDSSPENKAAGTELRNHSIVIPSDSYGSGANFVSLEILEVIQESLNIGEGMAIMEPYLIRREVSVK